MNGSSLRPSRATPVVIAVLISWSVQPPRPTPGSGVTLAATADHSKMNGLLNTLAPAPSFVRSCAPLTTGVWQSMQWPSGPARYSPYFTTSVFGTSGTDVTIGPKPFSGNLYSLFGTSLRIGFAVRMYATIARTSVSVMRLYQANDIGGPRNVPSGRCALRIAFTIWSSVHEPMPVSMSGVMLRA